MSLGYAAYKLGFELSPIILVDGVAGALAGMLPIVAITEAINFPLGLLNGASDFSSLDNFFAHFVPMPGATVINNQVGHYPFANQQTAANAIIAQPLTISLRMICPVRQSYAGRLAIMETLIATVAQHINLGGTFTVVTPSHIYTGCLLLGLTDITAGEGNQAQIEWRWDFERPLLSLDQAAGALNSLMSKIDGAQKLLPDAGGSINWSGLAQSIGIPTSLATGSLLSSAKNLLGSNTASSTLPSGAPTPSVAQIGRITGAL